MFVLKCPLLMFEFKDVTIAGNEQGLAKLGDLKNVKPGTNAD